MIPWPEVIEAVPRSLFVPEVIWADLGPGPFERIDRAEDPDRWAEAVAADAPLVTQLDDGSPDGSGLASSSSSMPTIVAEFLAELSPRDGDRVLEIGTGTGWTAAILSWAGLEVTSIEVDPAVAAQAEAKLKSAGYSPTLVVGDGAGGHPQGAPYDRVHATCAVTEIPYAWVEQTRPGGVIVCPYSPGFGFGSILRLDVLPDGTAVGRFTGSADYMVLRSQRPAAGPARRWAKDDYETTRTRLDPRAVRHAPLGADIVIAALVPGVISRLYTADDGSGEATFWVLDAASPDGPWASVDYEPGQDSYEVQQGGPRRLWDEVEAAYFHWASRGRPDISRLGLTLTPDGSRVWLDTPSNPLG